MGYFIEEYGSLCYHKKGKTRLTGGVMIMERVNFNPEWYGVQAKVLSRSERQMVVDYGCNGRGIVKNYSLFEGIQLCFLDFETDESMRAQKFNPDILQITHCQTGRYECEFANHTGGIFANGLFQRCNHSAFADFVLFPLGEVLRR